MANAVTKVNGIAIADIAKISGQNDSDLAKLNALEFTGTPADAHTLISTPLNITTSDTAVSTVTVTSGIDSTYDVYEFHFINIVPETNASILAFQVDTGTNTNYQQPITSTAAEAEHAEDDSGPAVQYRSNRDLANDDNDSESNYQQLTEYIYNGVGDESASGVLTLFAPSSGTYIKHWISVVNSYGNAGTQVSHHAGYINQTSAIDRIRFLMTANDPATLQDKITSGTIKMYGLATS